MVRHGQTQANSRGIVQSSARGGGGGLTRLGARQARVAGARIALEQRISFCVVSDGLRTLQTAELILQGVVGVLPDRGGLGGDLAADIIGDLVEPLLDP